MGKGGGERDKKKRAMDHENRDTQLAMHTLAHMPKIHLSLTRSCSCLLFPCCFLQSINGILHSIHDTKAFTAMASAQLVRAIQSVQSQELAKKEASLGEYLWIIMANI